MGIKKRQKGTATEQLIDNISKNKAFTGGNPFDARKPLESLPLYTDWLTKQSAAANASDKIIAKDYCRVLEQNEGLMTFLADFRISREDVGRYGEDKFTKEEKENLFWLYRIWLDDQRELIHNALEEDKIKKALGAEGRERLRNSLAKLGSVISEGQKAKEKFRTEFKSLTELKSRIISDLKLKWDPKETTSKELLQKLESRIKGKQDELAELRSRQEEILFPKRNDIPREDPRVLQVQCELIDREIQRLTAVHKELWDKAYNTVLARDEAIDGRRKGDSLLRTAQKDLSGHISSVAKEKTGLDSHLTGTRDEAKNEIETLYAELMPLLQKISDLNNEIDAKESMLKESEKTGGELHAKVTKPLMTSVIKSKQQELDAMYARKNEIFLRIGYLQDRVSTAKSTYTTQLLDERQFEEEAKHQLNLLKQIPRIEQALNIYCSSYKGSFPLFLYLGSFIRGDGDIIQSPSLLGKGVDILLKLPMVGGGLMDIEKCKAYDTGSMTISLKLGLSAGFKGKGYAASVGLAVEYNAGISVGDERTFSTISEFALKAGAKLEIQTFFKVALELEIAKWKGGFTFQDHYHWAAWLATRWGHYCARAEACDVYLSRSDTGPDQKPDQRALEELDRITAQILTDNELIQTVYAEIRQYLDYPVIRSKQAAFFESGSIDMGLLGMEIETHANLRRAHQDMMIVKNENGKPVEYEATYHTWEAGGSIAVGQFKVQITYSKTEDCPISILDGININVAFSPILPPELWVQVIDLLMGTLTGDGDVYARMRKLFTEVFKLALQDIITTYAKPYILEKTKSMEFNFFLTQGSPALWYLRTKVEFGKTLETSVPVYAFLYVDLGAQFKYMRTFNEVLGFNTITYPQYVHHGFKGVAKQRHAEGKPVYTLRPDTMSGEQLWKKYVDAHKHELWHMFYAIGTKQKTIRAELLEFKAKTEVNTLIRLCEEKATTTFKIKGEGMGPMVIGLFGDVGQVFGTLFKHLVIMKNKSGFESIQTEFAPILDAFNKLLDEEYRLMKLDEEKKNEGRFKRVLPPPRTAQEEIGDIFHAEDDKFILEIGWAAQLKQETGKDMKACERCLTDVKDYDRARELLLAPLIPEKYWVDDKEVTTCASCRKTIKAGMFSSNKHHCRICGGIFCENCCPSRSVPAGISKSKIRVCARCLAGLPKDTGLKLTPLELPSYVGHSKPVERPKAKSPLLNKTGTQEQTGPKLPEQPKSLLEVRSPTKEPEKVEVPQQPAILKPQEIKMEDVVKKDTVKTGEVKKEEAPKQIAAPGEEELYTDDHVNWLLEHYLGGREGTAVLNCIDAHLLGGNALYQNLSDALEAAFLKNQPQLVLPINVGGNHWVGLYMKFTRGDYTRPAINHVDPMGNEPRPDVLRVLKRKFPQGTLAISRRRYQVMGDGINCGPWTVALLEYLARHNGALPNLGAIHIGTRRTQDRVLMTGQH